ncbi:MAG: DUF3991 and toprim domain-containing protein [Defluviitaleaceae bacterium]|nr:DUF3991 and toprim domain-containing protein [Defluviitaleaceae bacterium]MCL2275006.1 DUF3991 and toprim domain-containing protein [Defluviitaleaceae bacterium]
MSHAPKSLPYTKEQIAQANSVNLIEYAMLNGYELVNSDSKSLHVKNSGGLYLFKNSNRFYHHTTDKTGGPIDFLMTYEHMDFLQAVEHLINERPNIGEYKPPPIKPKKERENMVLPDRAPNIKRIYWYLCNVRGIDPEIISKMVGEKKLYQQADRGNCVFVGYDENKIPRYCAKRGTSTERPYKGDMDNSDKGYPFSMVGTSNRVYVMESPIDVMSHATLCKLRGIDYTQDHRISLGCLSARALEWYLTQHPEIQQIIFAFDNDIDGKAPDGSPCNHGQKAAVKFADEYAERGYDTAIQTPVTKDFNEDLVEIRNARAAARVANRGYGAEDEAEP